MIASGLITTFLLSTALNKSIETRKENLEYYQKKVNEFFQNVSTWQPPDSSKAFFKIENENAAPDQWGSYDFIIVGSGSSGSVLTNRLTESGKFKVLVLEAGSYENDITDIPSFAGALMSSDFNWGYKTVPQTTACLAMKNQQCNYPRGKAIGGSSVINYMFYSRGNQEDFNKWEDDGNFGWSYDDVLPYFKKSEYARVPLEEAEFHGHEGLMNVEQNRYNTTLTQLFLEASRQFDSNYIDYNGENQIGFSRLQSTTINGRRCSGSKAFIKHILNRKNLEVVDKAFAIKISIENNTAYGVEFVKDGKVYTANASKEVILSAGAINSPQLLMLSGIGPKEHLEKLDIPPIQDLPIGKTLIDHFMLFALQFTTKIEVGKLNMVELLNNYLDGFGPLTAAAGATGISFMNNRMKSNTNPNLEYIFISVPAEHIYEFALRSLHVTDENWSVNHKPSSGKLCWMMIPVLLHSKSRGNLSLKSKDPFDFPLIDLNPLSDPENIDMEDMLNAVKYSFELSKTPAFQSIGSQYLSEPLPACKNFEHLSDDYWRCAIRQLTTTLYHPVATCKMGPPTDNMAVVNNRLKVYGIDSLRVIDASIIPTTTASHTNAVCYMIGEKGADIIREEYGDL